MADAKECPLCGTPMRLTMRRSVDWVPGTSESSVRTAAEWMCPQCDYYEEAEDDSRE